MAKSSSSTAGVSPRSRRVTLDPFNAILGVFFLVLAIIVPVAMPVENNRLNVLHYLGITICCLLAAFFGWRWLRAQLAHTLRSEAAEEVAEVRAKTLGQ